MGGSPISAECGWRPGPDHALQARLGWGSLGHCRLPAGWHHWLGVDVQIQRPGEDMLDCMHHCKSLLIMMSLTSSHLCKVHAYVLAPVSLLAACSVSQTLQLHGKSCQSCYALTSLCEYC